MGLFSNQLLNVVEWDETKEGVIFWKWPNDEIKKGSKLVIRPGQDAIFMYMGKIETRPKPRRAVAEAALRARA